MASPVSPPNSARKEVAVLMTLSGGSHGVSTLGPLKTRKKVRSSLSVVGDEELLSRKNYMGLWSQLVSLVGLYLSGGPQMPSTQLNLGLWVKGQG